MSTDILDRTFSWWYRRCFYIRIHSGLFDRAERSADWYGPPTGVQSPQQRGRSQQYVSQHRGASRTERDRRRTLGKP